LESRLPNGVPLWVASCPALYARGGGPYQADDGDDWDDNALRFGVLSKLAAVLGTAESPVAWRPEVIHCNDWPTALVPVYLRDVAEPRAKTLVTIHNLAFQGIFDRAQVARIGLPEWAYGVDALEFYGRISFLKGGLLFADAINTVSPTYAQEIQTPEQGCGLDGLLRKRRHVLSGILNGVDRAVWDPASDRAIAQTFDARTLPHKAANKAALQQQLGLAARADALLFGIVSRFTEQKGLHLVLAALPELLRRGGQLVALGSGEPALETAFRHAAHEHPRSVAVHIGFDEALSHRVFAGTDVTLVPSRFEPCGLTQMYGLAYGSLPLVHRVGGLADTVVDAALENLADGSTTGFVFDRYDATAYGAALRRAFALHARRLQWRREQRTAMQQVFDWGVAAASYLALYRTLLHPTHDHAVA
jgi:starch synthase